MVYWFAIIYLTRKPMIVSIILSIDEALELLGFGKIRWRIGRDKRELGGEEFNLEVNINFSATRLYLNHSSYLNQMNISQFLEVNMMLAWFIDTLEFNCSIKLHGFIVAYFYLIVLVIFIWQSRLDEWCTKRWYY